MRYALLIFVLVCAACGGSKAATLPSEPEPHPVSAIYAAENSAYYARGGGAGQDFTNTSPGSPAWVITSWDVDAQPVWEISAVVHNESEPMRLWLGIANRETGSWDWVAHTESIDDPGQVDLVYKIDADPRYLAGGRICLVLLADQGNAAGPLILGLETLAH